ncbi:hypothetical protein FA13DRAFT_1815757 [Coprinellus micaceus]|uniref:F-box domain-containing protein n=1 Tax=Coprinellus micaceus TaxID=71717 RepID=A0A4Y7T410_COPMI|nr:hypothetical protein FA13DRAFT_1815757 [Coprinellus micaceus]
MPPVSSNTRPGSEVSHSIIGPPAQQVLNNQELVSLIVDEVHGRVNRWSGTNKKVLATLATLNKAFFHATTETFWRHVPSLSPFLRLLPSFPKGDRAESELTMDKLAGDPWSRFLIYHRKVVRLELSDDKEIGKVMPNHWFFSLFHHPTRPVPLFPKLSELVISSVAGLNAAIPFHLASSLQRVTVNNITKKGSYEGQSGIIAMSLMTSLACASHALEELTMLSPVTPPMTALFPKYGALSFLYLSLPSPTPTETFASIGTLPNLRLLKLTSQGLTGTPTAPLLGQHLKKYHPAQGTSNIHYLVVEGDASFIYWATLFFASPRLRTYRASIPKADNRAPQNVLLVPHIVDLLGQQCPATVDFSIQSEALWTDHDTQTQLARWVNEPTFQPPTTVFQSFAKLKNLQAFTFRNIPDMKDISFLLIEPLPLTSQPQHALILPGLDILRDISVNQPRLQRLIVTLDVSTIPAPSNDIMPAIPGHPLHQLAVLPKNRAEPFEVSELIVLATYLDRLFPNLTDITTRFRPPREPNSTTVSGYTLWRDVDPLLKSFQAMRKQYAAVALAPT